MKNHANFFKLFLLSFFFLCFTSFRVLSQTKKISIQGFLKDGNSKAVDNGQYELTFKLYTVASGGTAIWTETNSAVNVYGGVYSVQLGAITSISTLAFDIPYYLGVTIQGTELTPRMELTYAPYALAVDHANFVTCSGAVGDVKYSILKPTQFASVNGACWVPMDGRTITGSALATLTSKTTVPDGSGLFIRNHEFVEGNDPNRTVGADIASIQTEDLKSHGHGATTDEKGDHIHGSNANGGNANGNAGLSYMDGHNTAIGTDDNVAQMNTIGIRALSIDFAGKHSHTVTVNNTGGTETRPKNIDFYVYIRIN